VGKVPLKFNINMERTFNAVGALEELGVKLFKDAQRRAGARSAGIIKAKMEEFLLNGRGEWPENHPITVKMKGFDWPLMETGQMAQSITFTTIERGSRIDYLVGFPAGPAADKALAAEFGKTTVVTDRMRRFMAANGAPLKADTKVLFIPPRQTFQPTRPERTSKPRQTTSSRRPTPRTTCRVWAGDPSLRGSATSCGTIG